MIGFSEQLDPVSPRKSSIAAIVSLTRSSASNENSSPSTSLSISGLRTCKSVSFRFLFRRRLRSEAIIKQLPVSAQTNLKFKRPADFSSKFQDRLALFSWFCPRKIFQTKHSHISQKGCKRKQFPCGANLRQFPR